MESVGDTIQTLEALGQDPRLQERPSIGHQEESGTGQCKFNINADADQVQPESIWCHEQDWQLQFGLETGKD